MGYIYKNEDPTSYEQFLSYYYYEEKAQEEKRQKEKREREQKEQEEKKVWLKKKAAFYEQCAAEGITDLNSESRRLKAANLANRMSIQFTDVVDLYKSSESAKDDLEKMQLDENERAFIEYQKMLMNKTGISKTIEMLEHKKLPYILQNRQYDAMIDANIPIPQIREKDWAIIGGIASGLAGPAMGLATALSVQEENTRIRQQNESMRHTVAALKVQYINMKSKNQRKINDIDEEIKQVRNKLIGRESIDDLFDLLDFYDDKVEVTKTGRIKVTTRVLMNKELIIYDDREAVIDGHITAEILCQDTKIGEAIIVLPQYGISTRGDTVYALSEEPIGDPAKDYTVQFLPYSLWSVEKL